MNNQSAQKPQQLRWIKARASMGLGACVEMARCGELILIRDPKHPESAALIFPRAEITAFLDSVKDGEFRSRI